MELPTRMHSERALVRSLVCALRYTLEAMMMRSNDKLVMPLQRPMILPQSQVLILGKPEGRVCLEESSCSVA